MLEKKKSSYLPYIFFFYCVTLNTHFFYFSLFDASSPHVIDRLNSVIVALPEHVLYYTTKLCCEVNPCTPDLEAGVLTSSLPILIACFLNILYD